MITPTLARPASGWATSLHLVVDLFFVVATSFFFSSAWRGEVHAWLWPLVVVACVVWAALGVVLRLYEPHVHRTRIEEAAISSILIGSYLGIMAFANLLSSENTLPSVELIAVIFWPATMLLRLSAFRRLREKIAPPDRVIIVGTGALGRITGESLQKTGHREVVGYIALPGETDTRPLPASKLGAFDQLEQVLYQNPVEEIFISANIRTHAAALEQCVQFCEREGLPFALPASPVRLQRALLLNGELAKDGYLHYASVAAKPYQHGMKRLIDIVASACAIVILSPLLIAVASIIKLTSKGPILFQQTRVGLYGRHFTMLKFRSMVINAEELKTKLTAHNEMGGPVFKIRKDPRVTPIGRFIRKYSIDELPQFFNVLLGDMSLVGPRPPIPSEVQKYEPWQRRRLSVRPGLTCIWQVSGRNQISFEEWMMLDMRYIDNWDLLTDVRLILQTIPVVITGRGAS